MSRMLMTLIGVSLLAAVAAADDKKPTDLTDPVEILKKVDAAAKAVKGVKYDVEVKATGQLAARVPAMKASVTAAGMAQGMPENFLVDAEVAREGSAEAVKLLIGGDSDKYYVIHHASKTAYVDIDPVVLGASGQIAQGALMIEFLHPTPFTDEINGKSQKLVGTKKVAGEECYEVEVVYAAAQAPKATWFFSKKDFLPRRRVDTWDMEGMTGTMDRTLSNLVVDPKLEKGMFKPRVPEGYKETDEAAPNFFATP